MEVDVKPLMCCVYQHYDQSGALHGDRIWCEGDRDKCKDWLTEHVYELTRDWDEDEQQEKISEVETDGSTTIDVSTFSIVAAKDAKCVCFSCDEFFDSSVVDMTMAAQWTIIKRKASQVTDRQLAVSFMCDDCSEELDYMIENGLTGA